MTFLVAPLIDMISVVVNGITHTLKPHDLYGKVLDAPEDHVAALRAHGFKSPSELPASQPIEVVTAAAPVIDLTKDIEEATGGPAAPAGAPVAAPPVETAGTTSGPQGDTASGVSMAPAPRKKG